MQKIKKKPIPYQLSQWDSRTEIFYKCPDCGQDFRFFGSKEKFCHDCGCAIDWSTSERFCTPEFQQQYEELVYNQHAYISGKRSQDIRLFNLFYNLYKEQLNRL